MSICKQFSLEEGLLFEAAQDDVAGSAAPLLPPRHIVCTEYTVLPFVSPFLRANLPPHATGKPRFFVPQPEMREEQVRSASQWYVFVGCVLSPQLIACLKNGIVIIFDPNRHRVNQTLSQFPLPLLARKNIFIFAGDSEFFNEPLRYIIPPSLTDYGVPVIFAHEALPPEYILNITQKMEVIYYHYQLYPYETQRNTSSSYRYVSGGFSFAQQKHLQENLRMLPLASTVGSLAERYAGTPALLVTAAVSLETQFETIRRLRGKCILICANKAANLLIEHHIIPDFVVLLDSSTASAEELGALAGHPECNVVAYTLSGACRSSGNRIFYFGHELEDLGLPSHMVDHLGSVINYQLHLAQVMGCTQVIFAGLSLCAAEQYGGGYAGAGKKTSASRIIWQCPVKIPGCIQPRYTSPNFLDVAHWLQAYIQSHNMQAVNMTRESLLFGKNVRHDAEPLLNAVTLARPLDLPPQGENSGLEQTVTRMLHTYALRWKESANIAASLLAYDDKELIERFAVALERFDRDGTTQVVDSSPHFRDYAPSFHNDFFRHPPPKKAFAARKYLRCLSEIAQMLGGGE